MYCKLLHLVLCCPDLAAIHKHNTCVSLANKHIVLLNRVILSPAPTAALRSSPGSFFIFCCISWFLQASLMCFLCSSDSVSWSSTLFLFQCVVLQQLSKPPTLCRGHAAATVPAVAQATSTLAAVCVSLSLPGSYSHQADHCSDHTTMPRPAVVLLRTLAVGETGTVPGPIQTAAAAGQEDTGLAALHLQGAGGSSTGEGLAGTCPHFNEEGSLCVCSQATSFVPNKQTMQVRSIFLILNKQSL